MKPADGDHRGTAVQLELGAALRAARLRPGLQDPAGVRRGGGAQRVGGGPGEPGHRDGQGGNGSGPLLGGPEQQHDAGRARRPRRSPTALRHEVRHPGQQHPRPRRGVADDDRERGPGRPARRGAATTRVRRSRPVRRSRASAPRCSTRGRSPLMEAEEDRGHERPAAPDDQRGAQGSVRGMRRVSHSPETSAAGAAGSSQLTCPPTDSLNIRSHPAPPRSPRPRSTN